VGAFYARCWIWTSENLNLPRTPVHKGKMKGSQSS
jgi:hypothetical protein